MNASRNIHCNTVMPLLYRAHESRVVRHGISGDVVMTHVSIRSADQGSRFNDYVAGALTAAVLALSAVMFFSQFAA
jgi:hypothetical protein